MVRTAAGCRTARSPEHSRTRTHQRGKPNEGEQRESSASCPRARGLGSYGTRRRILRERLGFVHRREAPSGTDAAVETTTADTEPADTEPADTEPADTEPADTTAPEGGEGFLSLPAPDGEPIIVGMVNTEGSPGLDFPEISESTRAAVDFLNEHGGIGGRPIEFEVCTAAGSPETSQACSQELAGKDVEIVMLGLDLFPGYDTFTASNIPVTGILPILPGDYTANALFLGGGNTTTTSAMAAFAQQNFGATTAGIVSADNDGANGTEADLKKALDAVGITYVSIKGGDNETDAGFQGLMAQATADDPDVLFSLYADAGCIGTMRGRVSLGIETPVITTAICSSAEVIDVVGDDAVGWYFIGASTEESGTPEADDLQAILRVARLHELHGARARWTRRDGNTEPCHHCQLDGR